MIKKYWKSLLISSLFTLFPVFVGLILWDRLPQVMVTHWGFDGQPDGWGGPGYVVFLAPVLMLIGQWVCILFTARDPGNKGRNEKPQKLVLWIIPVMSNLCSGMMYALALGMDFSPAAPMSAVLGLMFVVIGNYMPKTRMNSTIGIKVHWAYTSEENWNATHRFGGKVWVIGGTAMLFAALLPEKIGMGVTILAIFVLAIIPIVYSYLYYRKQKEQGDSLIPMSRLINGTGKFSLIFVTIILTIVAILMFTGEVNVRYGEDSFTIEASWYPDLTVDYDAIETIEYRESSVDGSRVGGWGSARLLLGFFRNEEFGNYTRYTYTKPESCVVIYTGSRVLVLSGKTAEETQAIYQNLLVLTEAQ